MMPGTELTSAGSSSANRHPFAAVLAGRPRSGPLASEPSEPRQCAASTTGSGGGGSFFGGDGLGGSGSGNGKPKQKVTDDSTIFSLDQLSASAGQSGRGSRPGENEDSGLIDLQALAAGVPTDSVLSGPLDILGGSSPQLFDAPPPVAASAPEPLKAKSGSSSMLIGVLALSVLGLGAAMAFVLVRGSGAGPAQAQAAVTTVIVTQPAPAAAEPEPEPSSSASAADSAAAAAKNALPKGKLPGRGQLPTSPQTQPGTVAAAPAAPARPAAGPCGCMPEDLMCNMRCAQKNKKK